MSEVKGGECPLVPAWQLGVCAVPSAFSLSAAGLADAKSHSLSVSWDVPPPLLTYASLERQLWWWWWWW